MKIVQYPHPALRHRAKRVTTIDGALRRFVGELLELMHKHKGLGLAAPQVAMPFQVFVMNMAHDPEQRDKDRVYINPVISDRRGMIEGEEGCLSFPDLYQKVKRAKQIRVQAYDLDGKPIDRQLSDLEARVVQHETDHLLGVLYIDKFSDIGKLASRTALAEFEAEYRRLQEKGEIPPNKALLRQLRESEEKGFGE